MAQDANDGENGNSIVDLYHPVILTRDKKKAQVVIGPEYILMTPDDYELARSLFSEQRLGYLLGKDRRTQEKGIYMFDISKEPKEVHDKLSVFDVIVPEVIPKKNIDIFSETGPVIEHTEKWKMPESNMMKLISLQRKRTYRPSYKASIEL